MVERAQRMDGTATGEHGVGIGKKVRYPSPRDLSKVGRLTPVTTAPVTPVYSPTWKMSSAVGLSSCSGS